MSVFYNDEKIPNQANKIIQQKNLTTARFKFCLLLHDLWWRKSLTTHFSFDVGIKKMSLGAKSGLYVGLPINSNFWPVKRGWFKLVCWSSHYYGAQWSVLSSTVRTLLKRNSPQMTSFTDETGDPLLRSASSKKKFHWIRLVFEDGRLLFCFVTCDDVINVY